MRRRASNVLAVVMAATLSGSAGSSADAAEARKQMAANNTERLNRDYYLHKKVYPEAVPPGRDYLADPQNQQSGRRNEYKLPRRITPYRATGSRFLDV